MTKENSKLFTEEISDSYVAIVEVSDETSKERVFDISMSEKFLKKYPVQMYLTDEILDKNIINFAKKQNKKTFYIRQQLGHPPYRDCYIAGYDVNKNKLWDCNIFFRNLA